MRAAFGIGLAAEATSNASPRQEFKGEGPIPLASDTSTLACKGGIVRCLSGPGFGITIEPAFVAKAEVVTSI